MIYHFSLWKQTHFYEKRDHLCFVSLVDHVLLPLQWNIRRRFLEKLNVN